MKARPREAAKMTATGVGRYVNIGNASIMRE
jgi:hypothetical protein